MTSNSRSVIITTNLVFAESASVFVDPRGVPGAARPAAAHHCHIVKIGDESCASASSSQTAKARIKSREQARLKSQEVSADTM